MKDGYLILRMTWELEDNTKMAIKFWVETISNFRCSTTTKFLIKCEGRHFHNSRTQKTYLPCRTCLGRVFQQTEGSIKQGNQTSSNWTCRDDGEGRSQDDRLIAGWVSTGIQKIQGNWWIIWCLAHWGKTIDGICPISWAKSRKRIYRKECK